MLRVAWAQTYPSRPVRLVVATPAGGPADVLARLICQWLSERLGQPFLVENRPGAGTNIATELVVRSPGDGYTLLMASGRRSMDALREARFQLHSRHHRGRGCHARSPRHGGEPVNSSQDGLRVHRIRKECAGQGQHGIGRKWCSIPYRRCGVVRGEDADERGSARGLRARRTAARWRRAIPACRRRCVRTLPAPREKPRDVSRAPR